MDIANLAQTTIHLGIIPTLALSHAVVLHRQLRKFSGMLEKQEQNNTEVLTALIQQITEYDSLIKKQDQNNTEVLTALVQQITEFSKSEYAKGGGIDEVRK